MTQEEIRRETRNNIISIVEGLIWVKGYNGFVYADVALRLGIRNSAVHDHFPTTSDLPQAVINQELERMVQYKKRPRVRFIRTHNHFCSI